MDTVRCIPLARTAVGHAIKVLPEDFATDPERLARFEREAKLLASLNHANIAAIYGLEDEGDRRFIVMEVVEGETLADQYGVNPFASGDALKEYRRWPTKCS